MFSIAFSLKQWYNNYAKPTEYFSKGYFYLYGIIISFLRHVYNEFVKMQIPTGRGKIIYWFLLFQLVWRLLEFAFLCAGFGWRTFFTSNEGENYCGRN